MIRRLLIAAAFLAALLSMGAAGASGVPYNDPSAVGTLTLCDTLGNVATHGNIHTKPFVWRAVGSQSATGAYAGAGRTAALYGYQPIDQVDPSQWEGQYLTAGSRYSNGARPMAAATAADPSLADLLAAYPTKWDGLIQLRMFLGAPGAPTYTSTYNAATIKVSGDQWTLVQGGHSGCGTGTSSSAELALPSVAKLPTPAPNATTDVPPKPGSSGAGPGATGGGSTTGPTGGSGSGSAGGAGSAATSGGRSSAAAASSSSSSGSSATPWIVTAVAVVLIAAGVGYWRLRPSLRRR